MPAEALGHPQRLGLDEARARLPLLRAVVTELRDRIQALQALEDPATGPALEEALRLRDRILGCMEELRGLGAEVESLQPVVLHFHGRDGEGGERLLRWTEGDERLEPVATE